MTDRDQLEHRMRTSQKRATQAWGTSVGSVGAMLLLAAQFVSSPAALLLPTGCGALLLALASTFVSMDGRSKANTAALQLRELESHTDQLD